MDLDLAEMYGTPGATEDLEKQAQAELFAKLAADQGVDLQQLTDEQVEGLWADTFADDGSAKIAEAQYEHAAMQDNQEKLAEADHYGRVMAHAYVQELGEIDKHGSAGTMLDKGLKKMRPLADIASGKDFRQGRQALKNIKSPLGAKMRVQDAASSIKGRRGSKKHKAAVADVLDFTASAAKGMRNRGAAKTLGLYGGAAAAAGGAVAGKRSYDRNKTSSAIDEFAVYSALEKAAEAGFDVDEVASRLDAVIELDQLPDSDKVASSLDEQVDIRSLEMLEAVGVPVNWY